MYSFKFSRIKALKWHQDDENRMDIKILKGISEKLIIVNIHNNSELVAKKPRSEGTYFPFMEKVVRSNPTNPPGYRLELCLRDTSICRIVNHMWIFR